MTRNSRIPEAFRELPVGARQLPKRFELASEQHAEPSVLFCADSRQGRSLTVTAGGYKVLRPVSVLSASPGFIHEGRDMNKSGTA